jgi:hypothetical protein
MCKKGYSKISILLGVTILGVLLKLVFSSLLQKIAKFSRADGLLYQSPPPLYFKTAISCPWQNCIKKSSTRVVRKLIAVKVRKTKKG